MTITLYSYNKLCNSNRLSQEIKASAEIITSESHIETTSAPAATKIYMKAALSLAEQTALDALVNSHVNQPLPDDAIINVDIQGQPPVTVQSSPPFYSKTLVINEVTKKLFARNLGFQQAVTIGTNTISYSIPYPWLKMLGVEVINCEALDSVNFKVYDSPAGTYSGIPNLLLNQFAFSINLPKDFYAKESRFDADIYFNMVISIEYTSISNKTVGINLLMNEVKD
jgi:hypothetical protein